MRQLLTISALVFTVAAVSTVKAGVLDGTGLHCRLITPMTFEWDYSKKLYYPFDIGEQHYFFRNGSVYYLYLTKKKPYKIKESLSGKYELTPSEIRWRSSYISKSTGQKTWNPYKTLNRKTLVKDKSDKTLKANCTIINSEEEMRRRLNVGIERMKKDSKS